MNHVLNRRAPIVSLQRMGGRDTGEQRKHADEQRSYALCMTRSYRQGALSFGFILFSISK